MEVIQVFLEVLITDISDFRLDIAKKCGIDFTANVNKEPFEEAIKQVFGNEGFHVGFEAVGIQSTIDNLVNSIQKGGEIDANRLYSPNR